MKSRYLTVLVVLNSILLIGLIVLWVWRYIPMNAYDFYVSTYGVASLSRGAKVRFHGVPAGKVKKIDVDGKQILLKLQIFDNVRLPVDVRFVNVMGAGEPALLCQGGASTELIAPGDTIFQERIPPYYPGSEEGAVQDPRKWGLLIDHISAVVEKLDETIGSRKDKGNLSGVISNFSALSAELAETVKNLNTTFITITEQQSHFEKEWKAYLKNLQVNSEQQNKRMQTVINNYLESSLKMEEYSARMVNVAEKMEKAVDAVNSDSGSLGKLIYDKELYQNLKNASLELNQLIKDFRKNPRQFFDSSVF